MHDRRQKEQNDLDAISRAIKSHVRVHVIKKSELNERNRHHHKRINMNIIITIIVLLDAYYHKFKSHTHTISAQCTDSSALLQRLSKQLNDNIGILSAFFRLFIAWLR